MYSIPKEILNEYNADGYIVLANSDIRYFSGLVSSNIAILVTKGESFVFSDGRYKYRIEAQKIYTPVVCTESILKVLTDKIKELDLKKVLVDPTAFSYDTFLKRFSDIKDRLILKTSVTENLRAVKREDEIRSVKTAQQIAEESLREIFPLIKAGVTTAEIAAKLDFVMKLKGSEAPAFDTIVLSGAQSADCHGIPDNTEVKEGEFVLFDFGATVNGYRSDMTRTVVYGEPDEFMEKMYNIVLEAHKKSANEIKDGAKASDVDLAGRNYITNEGYGEFFLHSTGHGVGLDIHEYPTVSYRSETILKKNMLITIEPGIYLENRFGIRIEDTYIVGEHSGKSIALMEKTLIKLK